MSLRIRTEHRFPEFPLPFSRTPVWNPRSFWTPCRHQEASGRRPLPLRYKTYQKKLKQGNSVDFDDLLILPIKLFKNYPNVLNDYQERYK